MLIEVTEGARAAGSEPVYTDFIGRQLLVLENAVNINFSGFTSFFGVWWLCVLLYCGYSSIYSFSAS